MNVLAIEGAKYDIRVNASCPTAATRMTEGLMPEAVLALMTPESVSAAAVFLVSEDAPRRTILAAIAGGYSRIVIQETRGVYLHEDERTPETIAARFGEIADLTGAIHSEQPGGPGLRFLQLAACGGGCCTRQGHMKALLSTRPGGPETLALEDAPDPVAGAGEVVVAMHACGVNFPTRC